MPGHTASLVPAIRYSLCSASGHRGLGPDPGWGADSSSLTDWWTDRQTAPQEANRGLWVNFQRSGPSEVVPSKLPTEMHVLSLQSGLLESRNG